MGDFWGAEHDEIGARRTGSCCRSITNEFPIMEKSGGKWFCAWVDAAISQNIYLYCAVSNLGTAVLALVDRETLHTAMHVQDHENIVVKQVVVHSIE